MSSREVFPSLLTLSVILYYKLRFGSLERVWKLCVLLSVCVCCIHVCFSCEESHRSPSCLSHFCRSAERSSRDFFSSVCGCERLCACMCVLSLWRHAGCVCCLTLTFITHTHSEVTVPVSTKGFRISPRDLPSLFRSYTHAQTHTHTRKYAGIPTQSSLQRDS